MLGIRTKLMRLRLAEPARRQHERTLRVLKESGKPPKSVLFLCYGNICRSPVAEKLAQRLMPAAHITSAGFYPRENRPTPRNVQEAARSIGIDVTAWSSRRVSREMVDHADLVVILDLKNFRNFRREFPDDQGKVAFLGLFLNPPQLDITDPYNLADDETLQIVRLVENAIQELARQMA